MILLCFIYTIIQVVCRQLGLHYAQVGTQTDMFNPPASVDNITTVIETTDTITVSARNIKFGFFLGNYIICLKQIGITISLMCFINIANYIRSIM